MYSRRLFAMLFNSPRPSLNDAKFSASDNLIDLLDKRNSSIANDRAQNWGTEDRIEDGYTDEPLSQKTKIRRTRTTTWRTRPKWQGLQTTEFPWIISFQKVHLSQSR